MHNLFSKIKDILLYDITSLCNNAKECSTDISEEYKYPNDCRKCKYYRPITNNMFECDIHLPCFKNKE